jgi:hypothetical protein
MKLPPYINTLNSFSLSVSTSRMQVIYVILSRAKSCNVYARIRIHRNNILVEVPNQKFPAIGLYSILKWNVH